MTAQAEVFANKFDKKSGKGNQDGVVSELTTFWTVKPGHASQLREALVRFEARLRELPEDQRMKTGIRDARIVLFDNDTRMLFATHFETDWDPYIDDVVLVIGMRYFLDWMEHVVEGDRIHDWARRSGITQFDVNDPSLDELIKRSGGEFKVIIQGTQVGCDVYINVLNEFTAPEIIKAARVNKAFQQVLDDPDAEAVLQEPALKPLLDQASA